LIDWAQSRVNNIYDGDVVAVEAAVVVVVAGVADVTGVMLGVDDEGGVPVAGVSVEARVS
jgi:hypothetical protein